MTLRVLFCLALSAFPLGASAQSLIANADIRACVFDAMDGDRPVAGCLNVAHSNCISAMQSGSRAAASACFAGARQEWVDAVSARLEELEAADDPRLRAVAQVEVKFDILRNGLECDRMNELGEVQGTSPVDREATKIRCDATAAGLAYIKLLAQSRAALESDQ